jgi:Polyketide cyclase / dehydrase and lipid transport
MAGTSVSVDRVIGAPAASIFDVVADVSRHPEMDGSGALVKPKGAVPQRLSMGSTFGMSMKLGVPYSTTNTVIEFEPDRRIAWQTVLAGPLGRFIGGRIWRYELEAVDGGTKVTETWDISRDKQAFFLRHKRVGEQTAASMSSTLGRLAEMTESAGTGPQGTRS